MPVGYTYGYGIAPAYHSSYYQSHALALANSRVRAATLATMQARPYYGHAPLYRGYSQYSHYSVHGYPSLYASHLPPLECGVYADVNGVPFTLRN